MSFDAHKNFSISTVATAPSPATSGTSLVVATGDGTLFPAPSTDGAFNVVVWPAGVTPTHTNAEVCRVTARSTDTLTITRTQEGTSARTIIVGDQIALNITAKLLTDIESGRDTLFTVGSSSTALTVNVANGPVQDITLTGNCTFTLTSPASGDAWNLTLILRQDGTGSRTVTWPGSVVWLGTGIPPTLQTIAASVDSVVLYTVDGGTTWFGVAQTSASGLRSGTSFPGSPSDGDLFYRTDRKILYEFDTTSTHWLSLDRKYFDLGMGDLLDNGTTAGTVRRASIVEDVYIESWGTTVYVNTTNNGSNFWSFALRKATGAYTPTNLATFTTAADSVTTLTSHLVSIGVVLAASGFPLVDVNTTKTGSPGALRCPSFLIVRSVG